MKGEKITMNTPKITKKMYFDAIAVLANGGTPDIAPADIVAFCEKEIAALDNRAAKAKERAAIKRAEGDELQAAVLAALTDEFATRAEITERVGNPDASVAKVGYRLTQLVASGDAVKDEAVVESDGKSKKVAVYKLA